MSEPDDKLPSLETLQHKIDEAKARKGRQDAPGGAGEGMGQAMRFGVELVSGVAVGSIAGYALDRWLGTLPLFFIVCFFLGAAAGFRNMLREAARDNEDKKD